MSQKSLIEGKGTSVFAWRLLVAANCAPLRLLSSAHTQLQVQREATVIPSRVETPKSSNPDTSVSAAHDDNCGLTRVLVYAGLHTGVCCHRANARSILITSCRLTLHGSSLELFVEQTRSHMPESGMTAA